MGGIGGAASARLAHVVARLPGEGVGIGAANAAPAHAAPARCQTRRAKDVYFRDHAQVSGLDN